MTLFYFSAGLAILGSVLYHVFQKQVPQEANPGSALIAIYLIGIGLAASLYIFYQPTGGLVASFKTLNWSSFGIAVSILLIELGFLLMYRAGWNISLGAIVINVAATLVLVPLGVLLYQNKLSWVNLLGVGVCLIGLFLINWSK